VDVPQPVAAGVVQRRGPDLLEQLLDHRADPHDLRGLLDEVADGPAAVPVVVLAVAVRGHGHRAHRLTVRADHEDLLRALPARTWCRHAPILPSAVQPGRGVGCPPGRARAPLAAQLR
jgi:hypothetical protein